jgi:hypothetical protein
LFTLCFGGDVTAFITQAKPTGIFQKMVFAFDRGEQNIQDLQKEMPEGIWLECRGAHNFLYPPKERWPLQKWFTETFYAKFNRLPQYPAYQMWQALTAYKLAVEKASSLVVSWPTDDQIIACMKNLGFHTPSGYVWINEQTME